MMSFWRPIKKLPSWIRKYHSKSLRGIPPGGYIIIKGKRYQYKITDRGTYYKRRRSKKKNSKYSPFIFVAGILLLYLGLVMVWTYAMAPTNFNLEQGPVQKIYPYVLWGKEGSINIELYEGVNERLSSNKPRYNGNDRDYYLKHINEDTQREHLLILVDRVRAETTDADAQARIAISLVQHIPYDYSGMFGYGGSMRYPYQVLYDEEGICSEKTVLAAFLLKELGYGVALLEFPGERHMALGVMAPEQYTYKDTGYAFVEMTVPSIITDSDGNYMVVGKLTSNPRVYRVSNGKALGTLVGDEHRDAQEYRAILAKGFILDQPDYQRWQVLTDKYGI